MTAFKKIGDWAMSAGVGRRAAFAVLAVLLLAALLYVLDKYFAYQIAASYVSHIAQVVDLNEHLARAITLLVFAVLLALIGLAFSFNRQKRRAGILGLLALLILNSIVLWRGTEEQFFAADGRALKCYILDSSGVRYRERAGIDPQTGKPCIEVTADILERLKEYQRGRRPRQIENDNVDFFDSTTGSPRVWFYASAEGRLTLFDLMGFHPQNGVPLAPINKEIVNRWKVQQDEELQKKTPVKQRQAPKKVEGETAVFFDPITGEGRVWYVRMPNGDYEFFDNEGFHPRTGDKLKLIEREVVNAWQQHEHQKKQPKVAPAPAPSPPTQIPPVTRQPDLSEPEVVLLFRTASASFNRLPNIQQYEIQRLLTAAGYWQSVSFDQLNRRLLEAVISFQSESGLARTGFIDASQLPALRRAARPALQLWRLQSVKHPQVDTRLWIPVGLGFQRTQAQFGPHFSSDTYGVRIEFDYYPGATIAEAYRLSLATRNPQMVPYHIQRPDFFVIVTHDAIQKSYARFHSVEGGIVGFNVVWKNESTAFGDRLSTLMSDLFRGEVTLGQDIPPPQVTGY